MMLHVFHELSSTKWRGLESIKDFEFWLLLTYLILLLRKLKLIYEQMKSDFRSPMASVMASVRPMSL